MILPRKILGDAREGLKTLADASVHCCVTSPPYWRLRAYLPAGHPLKHLEIGSEPTIELYIGHLLEVFAEVWRVLRDDGTLWLNMGDCYASQGGPPPNEMAGGSREQCRSQNAGKSRSSASGLKPKDLCGIPWRVAFALQADGWYLRSMIPWIKRNVMPESVTDRPATAVEYVFMFSKAKRYYYDRFSIQVPASPSYKNDGRWKTGPTPENEKAGYELAGARNPKACHAVFKGERRGSRTRRNSDWFFESWQGLLTDEEGDPLALIVNPVGTRIKHFASYPPKLIEPIIKAATSEKGCCPKCGTPWQRLVKITDSGVAASGNKTKRWGTNHVTDRNQGEGEVEHESSIPWNYKLPETTGWKPSCECGEPESVPATVLDPFWGTGTTGMVATALGRQSIGCEIFEEYFRGSDIRDAQGALL